jgi:hypothetical protein
VVEDGLDAGVDAGLEPLVLGFQVDKFHDLLLSRIPRLATLSPRTT